jgi:hypothetical protein
MIINDSHCGTQSDSSNCDGSTYSDTYMEKCKCAQNSHRLLR